jgi:hypothetical protein
VLCGALVARNSKKLLAIRPEAEALASLALALFIVQVLWSTWQTLLVDGQPAQIAQRTVSAQRTEQHSEPKALRLPYTTPRSPLARLVHWWQTSAPTPSARLTQLIVPLLILVLSAIVSWQMTVLSLAAALLSLVERRVARAGSDHYALQAGTLLGLGWLAGHSAFAPLKWTSLILACCYAITYQGALYFANALKEREVALLGGTDSGPNRPPSWPLFLLYAGQGAALTLLAVLGRPLAATLLGVLLAPQWLLLAQLALYSPSTHRPYIQSAIPFVMIAMLIAAWAIPA